MRRVSSRQRLVSWDKFDANEVIESSDEEVDAVNSDDISIGYETAHSFELEDDVTFPIDHLVRYHNNGDDDDDDDDGNVERRMNLTPLSKRGDMIHVIKDITEITATTSYDESLAGCTGLSSSSRKRDRSAFSHRRSRKTKNDSLSYDHVTNNQIMHRQEPSEFKVPCVSTNSRLDSSNTNTSIIKSTSMTSVSSFATAVPLLVPGYSWEMTQSMPKTSTPPTFNTLMDDVHRDIFAFCDLQSLRSIMSLNRHYRHLVLSDDSMSALWLNHCHRKWNNVLNNDQTPLPSIVDLFHLPTAASPSILSESGSPTRSANLSLLLNLTPDELPTGVDESLLNVQQSRRNWRLQQDAVRRRNNQLERESESSLNDFVQYVDKTTGLRVVKFRGTVGSGDRCIRSDFPLPRPRFIHSDQKPIGIRIGGHFMDQRASGAGNLLKFLRRGAKKMVGGGNNDSSSQPKRSDKHGTTGRLWRPFVAPFVETSSKSQASSINCTPRLVSYFEVSILETPKEIEEESQNDAVASNNHVLDRGRLPVEAPATRHTNDCVAVGLGTESFHVHTRMPGWDRRSFGYHGDDSGLFHASGTMVRQLGQRFGAGDTVGCGVDYRERSIFFTLNGKFLGYGFSNIDDEFLKNDLYPVVGVDTNCPIFLNVGGEKEFAFDLGSFIMKDEDVISSTYCWKNEVDTSSDGSVQRRGSLSSIRSSSCRSIGSISVGSRRGSIPSSPRRRLNLGRLP